jgi:hypothetical protein
MTTVEEQMPSVAEAAEQQREKGNGKSRYVIFKRVEDGKWDELGTVESDGAYAARTEAIEKFDLMQEVRDGKLELVSLGARFWLPKKPKVNITESIDVS